MLSRLSSTFDSMKQGVQSARSFAGKTFDTVKSSLRDAFRPTGVSDFFDDNDVNDALVASRVAVQKSVRQQVAAKLMDETPGTDMFVDALRSKQRRSIFSVITLQMPEAKPSHGRRVERQPQYERGMTTSGMFGVQFWPKQEDLALDDPLSTFQAFAQFSQMDETPMTPSFQQEVRARAVASGMLDFDPLHNLNHGLATRGQYQNKPGLSKVTRVQPYPAPAAHAGGIAVAQSAPSVQLPVMQQAARQTAKQPALLADSWLTGRRTLDDMAQQFGVRALNAADV